MVNERKVTLALIDIDRYDYKPRLDFPQRLINPRLCMGGSGLENATHVRQWDILQGDSRKPSSYSGNFGVRSISREASMRQRPEEAFEAQSAIDRSQAEHHGPFVLPSVQTISDCRKSPILTPNA